MNSSQKTLPGHKIDVLVEGGNAWKRKQDTAGYAEWRFQRGDFKLSRTLWFA
jgi:hypothetical protein